ncbi:MAG: acyl-CoA synthetase [Acidiferrobacterales bacterium]
MNKDVPLLTIYDTDLDQVGANYVPLTPLSFLQRSSTVYPDKTAVIHGDQRYSYHEFADRCRRLAGALAAHGIGRGDTVSVMAPNIPAMLEAHYGVPMTGAVLNALNYRLDATTISFILDHAQTKVLITDREFSETISQVIKNVKHPLLVIDIDDPLYEGGELLGECDYESFLMRGEPDFGGPPLEDEWQAISLNYTSGTTGNPKGVVYHHRGAYLNALGQILVFNLSESSIYLWTLPMFHCNGWTYTWGVTAVAGTHVCLRRVDPALIFPMIKQHGVTHMCGAPIVLNMLIHAPAGQRVDFGRTVDVATGGAAPPSKVIAEMEGLGFRVTHLYGLTETYGPATVCAWQHAWDELDLETRTSMMVRQGVAYHTLEDIMIADPKTMEPVPSDGKTMGEVMVRGNTAMKGYLKNPNATNEAFRGGWLHTGDLGVRHPNGYVEIKDRAKDVIISGGENVSSLEVEEMLYQHPSIMEAAVVARPDEYWGETVCAFVTLKPDAGDVTAEDIIAWCRERLAKFKSPKHVVFGPLPKTPTGKIQKFVLREKTKEL